MEIITIELDKCRVTSVYTNPRKKTSCSTNHLTSEHNKQSLQLAILIVTTVYDGVTQMITMKKMSFSGALQLNYHQDMTQNYLLLSRARDGEKGTIQSKYMYEGYNGSEIKNTTKIDQFESAIQNTKCLNNIFVCEFPYYL